MKLGLFIGYPPLAPPPDSYRERGMLFIEGKQLISKLSLYKKDASPLLGGEYALSGDGLLMKKHIGRSELKIKGFKFGQ